MTGGRNHALWLGPLLAAFGFLSYYTIFYRWPALRDFPWLNLLLLAAAIAVSWAGWRRARAAGGWRRAAGVAGVAWSALLGGLFVVYCFYLSANLPSPGAALAEGQRVPSVTLMDHHGQPLRIGAGELTLLVFYRGHW